MKFYEFDCPRGSGKTTYLINLMKRYKDAYMITITKRYADRIVRDNPQLKGRVFSGYSIRSLEPIIFSDKLILIDEVEYYQKRYKQLISFLSDRINDGIIISLFTSHKSNKLQFDLMEFEAKQEN